MGADYDLFKGAQIEKSEKFRILYAGTFCAIRNIEPFLDAVKLFYEERKLKTDAEILFAGNVDGNTMKLIEDKHLHDKIQLLGYLPHDKIPPLLTGADVLLFWGNQGGLQLPGKLFEYVAARRPILCIKGDEKDPSLRILKDLNRAIMVDNRKGNIYSEIIRLYNLYQKQELDRAFDLREIPGFSWESRVEVLDGICERLTDANK